MTMHLDSYMPAVFVDVSGTLNNFGEVSGPLRAIAVYSHNLVGDNNTVMISYPPLPPS
jgi:hypothetical protein